MTHEDKGGHGTVAELRAILEAATPGPWHCEAWSKIEKPVVLCGPPMPSGQLHAMAEFWTYEKAPWTRRGEDNAALIAALRNAAPDLLCVVEAVAKLTPRHVPSGYSAFWRCDVCLGRSENGHKVQHADDCAWVLARKLTGGAT